MSEGRDWTRVCRHCGGPKIKNRQLCAACKDKPYCHHCGLPLESAAFAEGAQVVRGRAFHVAHAPGAAGRDRGVMRSNLTAETLWGPGRTEAAT